MKEIGTASAEQFMLRFFEEIKVPIHWENFVAENGVAKCLEIENRVDLGGLYTVWGMTQDGSYDQNHSLRVMDKFSEDRSIRLEAFPRKFLEEEVILLAAPAYRCCCGKYVLLDRTHRSICLYRTENAAFRMVIYVVEAQFVAQRPDNCSQCTAKIN